MNIEIKPCTDPDIIAKLNKTVQDIHFNEYPQNFNPWDFDFVLPFFRDTLKKDGWFCYTADIENIPVGYVLFCIRKIEDNPFRRASRSIYIDQISVLPEYQRSGAGTALMEHVETYAKEHGIRKIELTYWVKNIHAVRFYEKYGFRTQMKSVYKEYE